MKADRDINKLKSPFKEAVKAWLAESPEVFVTETLRSAERQAELRARGLSKVKVSNHQLGLAVDIAFYGSALYPSDLSLWRNLADKAKKHGIDWGYDLWDWDKPHFQKGKTLTPDVMKWKHDYTKILKDTVPEDQRVLMHEDTDIDEDERQIKAIMDIVSYRTRMRIKKDIT